MGRFLESMGCVAAYTACLGIAVIGVGCGGEGLATLEELASKEPSQATAKMARTTTRTGSSTATIRAVTASPLCERRCWGREWHRRRGRCRWSWWQHAVRGRRLSTIRMSAPTDTCDPSDGECALYDGHRWNVVRLRGSSGRVCRWRLRRRDAVLRRRFAMIGNECTADTCDPLDGECDYTNVTAGMTCNFGGLPGVCTAGVCEDAMLCSDVVCDDGNECTDDTCDPLDGGCGFIATVDGTTCDFGGLPGTCSGGTCEDAMLCATVDCDDGNACTPTPATPWMGAVTTPTSAMGRHATSVVFRASVAMARVTRRCIGKHRN